MQTNFELRYPGTILFGVGVRKELSRVLAEKVDASVPARAPIFLVAAKSVLTPPLLAELQALCDGLSLIHI